MSIWDILLEAIKGGNYDLIAAVLLISVSLWLYNEFRKSYMANKAENKIDIAIALERYSTLYFGISSFQSKDISSIELFEYINKAISYLPKRITKEILELNQINLDVNSEKLENIKQTIKDEINSVKLKQYTITTFDYKENIFEQVSWFLSKNNFDSFVQPFIYFFFALIGIIFVLSIAITIESQSGFSKIIISALFFNIIFFIFILMHLINLMLNGIAKVGFYKHFLLLIVVPLSLTIITFNYPIINAITIVINSITIIIFIYLSNKRKFMRPRDQ